MTFHVEICNWDKYNPRSDAKNWSWFRFQVDFFDDEDLDDLPGSHLLVFIYLCCKRAKSPDRIVELKPRHCAKKARTTVADVELALRSLADLGLVKIHTDTNADVRERTDTNATGPDTNADVRERPNPFPTDVTLRNDTDVTNERTGNAGSAAQSAATDDGPRYEFLDEAPAPEEDQAPEQPFRLAAGDVVESFSGPDLTVRVSRAKDIKPDARRQTPKRVRAPRAPAAPPPEPSDGTRVWEAYSEAYTARYRHEPIRNAKVNSQCKQLAARLGVERAMAVVRFYLTHNAGLYTRTVHALGPCLQDAEGLHTQMLANHRVTGSEAIQRDQQQGTVQAAANVLRKLQAEGMIKNGDQ